MIYPVEYERIPGNEMKILFFITTWINTMFISWQRFEKG